MLSRISFGASRFRYLGLTAAVAENAQRRQHTGAVPRTLRDKGRPLEPRGTDTSQHEWAWIASLLAGISIFSQMHPLFDLVITLVYLVAAIRLWGSDDFIVIYAVLAVFASKLYLYPGGVSTASFFLALYVLRMVVKQQRVQLTGLSAVFLLLLGLHGVFAVFPTKGSMVFLTYAATCAVVASLVVSFRNLEAFRRFMVAWTIGAIAACLYSLVNPNGASDDGATSAGGDFERFRGVLSDPNFMGLILVLGVVGAQLIAWHPFVVRTAVSAFLLVFVMQTGSLTSLIALILVGLALILSGRTNRLIARLVIVTVVVLLMIAGWAPIGAALAESEAYRFLTDRVVGEAASLGGADFNSMGSGRVTIAQHYLDYYLSQDALEIVLGGNVVGNYGLSDALATALGSGAMPHNFHIELLISVGLLGWAVFTLTVASSTGAIIVAIARQELPGLWIFALTKMILLVYSFSLSMFPTWWVLALVLSAPSLSAAPTLKKRGGLRT